VRPSDEVVERVIKRLTRLRVNTGISSQMTPPPRLGRILGHRLIRRIALAAAKEALLEDGEVDDGVQD